MPDNRSQKFDKERIRRAFDNAADTYDSAAVVQKEICIRLLERLDVIKINPESILDAGCGTGEALRPLHNKFNDARIIAMDISPNMLSIVEKSMMSSPDSLSKKVEIVCADIEQLPFTENSMDIIFSNLSLQWCNDLELTLQKFKYVLKPEGLLIFSTFGPDTLHELKNSWKQVDNAKHVNSFTDMHDIGDALLKTGFSGPVMESEIITVTYKKLATLFEDLKAIGANVPETGYRKAVMTVSLLKKVETEYENYRVDSVLPASYEVIYGHAWGAENVENTDTGAGVFSARFLPR